MREEARAVREKEGQVWRQQQPYACVARGKGAADSGVKECEDAHARRSAAQRGAVGKVVEGFRRHVSGDSVRVCKRKLCSLEGELANCRGKDARRGQREALEAGEASENTKKEKVGGLRGPWQQVGLEFSVGD